MLEIFNNIEEFSLKNGLRVVVLPLKYSPVVSVWCWYKVGAVNEIPTQRGISHWVEHMLFKGTKNIAMDDMKRLIEIYGGVWNGYTWVDSTTYLEQLSKSGLEYALKIESERMVSTLFEPNEVESERYVVISELEGAENQPEYYLDFMSSIKSFDYHPYKVNTIGFKKDLLKLTRADLYNHYKKYYQPGNATLIVVGDVSIRNIKQLTRKMFGTIKTKSISKPSIPEEPLQNTFNEFELRLNSGSNYCQMNYKTNILTDDERRILPLLTYFLTGHGQFNIWEISDGIRKKSYFYKRFVQNKLVNKIDAFYVYTRYPNLFKINTQFDKKYNPRDIANKIHKSLSSININNSDLKKIKNQFFSDMVFDSNPLNLAHVIGYYYNIDQPEYIQNIKSIINKVTIKQINQISAKLFQLSNATFGYLYHSKKSWLKQEKFDFKQINKGQPSVQKPFSIKKKYTNWKLDVKKRILDNGMNIYFIKNDFLPYSVMRYFTPAGLANKGIKEGVPYLTRKLLSAGLKKDKKDLINDYLDSTGTVLTTNFIGKHYTSIQIKSLTKNTKSSIDMLKLILTDLNFTKKQFDIEKYIMLNNLKSIKLNTQRRALLELNKLIYKGHPYSKVPYFNQSTLNNIKLNDVKPFYTGHFLTDKSGLVLVGNFNETKTLKYFNDTLGQIKLKEYYDTNKYHNIVVKKDIVKDIKLKDKKQTDIAIAIPFLPKNNPYIFESKLFNDMFGRSGLGGRIGERIREKEGLAYYAYGNIISDIKAGYLLIHCGVNTGNVDKTLNLVNTVIAEVVKKGFTTDEIDSAKYKLVNRLPVLYNNNETISGLIQNIIVYGLGDNYIEKYIDRIKQLTKTDINKIIKVLFDDYNSVRVTVG